MMHRVRQRTYTMPQLVQIPTEVHRERSNKETGGYSWLSSCYNLLFDE